ncbi:DUF4870 domain-containing protein [Synechococcales cyanobacterium C]|uniref:DUF4870 domain-containing protein n=1 Tax=Petrachloros mirabilis ULC683 TaxID=2781853 RepID=A0A8K1ZY92_9CYAN|nr:DUF4870 domain-containing protein [Petrachloros mirabilis]NCJ06313.1 DUF4870 domain-containing protein [Petrachloros mirabilis ULC683]
MVSNIYDSDKRKLLSALCHGSIFFSALVLSIGVPLVVLFVSDDPVVKENAKEAINFHLNIWFYALVAGVIGFFWWTLILLPVIWIVSGFLLFMSWIMPILAIMGCLSNPDQGYRYPLIVRLV